MISFILTVPVYCE